MRPGNAARTGGSGHDDHASGPGRPRRFGLTVRAVVLGAALLLVLVMITPSLGIYFKQRSQISRIQTEQAQTQASISALQDEAKRWQDPDFVRTRARSELGWVMPGETGYQVIGADGKVMGASTSLDSGDPGEEAGAAEHWWVRLSKSVTDSDVPSSPSPLQRATPSPQGGTTSRAPSPSPTSSSSSGR